jgi:hypothetical protein
MGESRDHERRPTPEGLLESGFPAGRTGGWPQAANSRWTQLPGQAPICERDADVAQLDRPVPRPPPHVLRTNAPATVHTHSSDALVTTPGAGTRHGGSPMQAEVGVEVVERLADLVEGAAGVLGVEGQAVRTVRLPLPLPRQLEERLPARLAHHLGHRALPLVAAGRQHRLLVHVHARVLQVHQVGVPKRVQRHRRPAPEGGEVSAWGAQAGGKGRAPCELFVRQLVRLLSGRGPGEPVQDQEPDGALPSCGAIFV